MEGVNRVLPVAVFPMRAPETLHFPHVGTFRMGTNLRLPQPGLAETTPMLGPP